MTVSLLLISAARNLSLLYPIAEKAIESSRSAAGTDSSKVPSGSESVPRFLLKKPMFANGTGCCDLPSITLPNIFNNGLPEEQAIHASGFDANESNEIMQSPFLKISGSEM